jgi:Co/Zn/Cd efflux system component
MGDCCNNTADSLVEKQRGTLIAVLVINAIMFVVVLTAAQFAKSSALFADSLDNLGDALTYGISLAVIASSQTTKARVALFKGSLIILAALLVLSQVIYRLINPGTPIFELIGAFSLLALLANSICLALLWRHRNQDINMSSVWECSRNDIATNLAVLLTAGAVWLFGSGWPDIIVAACLIIFLLRSSARVIRDALAELRTGTPRTA